ncbi:sensor histidine kinase [Paenibacillus sp. strain BS8-2]
MKRFKQLAGFLAIVFGLLVAWSIAYWATTSLFQVIPYSLNEWSRLLINSLLGFFLFGLFIFLITRNPWVRARQEQQLVPLIQAMKMMSEGNFNIDLSLYLKQFHEHGNHPYYQIVENINNMATKLGEMEELRQEFISNVSHEIQSPLTSISGFAHTLKNDKLSPEERRHYLEIIEKESIRLSHLSENLLKLTSLESEHLSLEQRSYRLDYQLRRILLANEPQWEAKELNLEVHLDKVVITADEDLMDQVWINLIHNSIKFTPPRGTLAITATSNAEGSVLVKIRDTGIGMEKNTMVHIFERFYKADQSRNRKAGGNGLGLSIVKRIVDLHKGDIRVQSELGAGTEITVSLNGRGSSEY